MLRNIKLKKENILKIIKVLFIICIFIFILIAVIFGYSYQKEREQEKIFINNIKKDVNELKQIVSFSGVVKGDLLNIDIKNIGKSNILGIKFIVRFENIFGEKLHSCSDENNCSRFDYDSFQDIELQKRINSGEKIFINKKYNFGIKEGSGINFSLAKGNYNVIIKSIQIYELVLDNGKYIKLPSACIDNLLYLKHFNIKVSELCY